MDYFKLPIIFSWLISILFSCAHNKEPEEISGVFFISEPLTNRPAGYDKELIHDENCRAFFTRHFPIRALEAKYLNAAQMAPLNEITQLNWKTYFANDSVVHLDKIFPNQQNKIVYMAEIIEADSSHSAILSLGSDDGISVWLNGDSLTTVHKGRSLSRHDDFIEITLNAGKNVLLYKIDQGLGDWGLYRKILNPNQAKKIYRHNAAPLYSDMLEFCVIADSARQISVRADSRRQYDRYHRIKLIWKTINGEISFQQNISPLNFPRFIGLPPDFSGTGILEVQALSLTGKTVYKEELPVFTHSAAIRLYQSLIHLKTKNPTGLARLQGLKKLWAAKAKRKYSTRMKAAMLLDIYRFFNNKPFLPAQFTGSQILGYQSDIDSSAQPYKIFVPAAYNPSKPYPLTFITHGVFDKEQDFWESIEGGSHRYLVWRTRFSTENDHIFVMPHGRGVENYLGKSKEELPLILQQINRLWNIDSTRIAILAYSRGARNILKLLTEISLPLKTIVLIGPIIHEDETQLYSLLLRIKKKYPALTWHIRHGLNDSVAPLHLTRALVQHLKKMGFQIDYEELPHSNHFCHLIDPERQYYQKQYLLTKTKLR
jgi:predicted esterase